MKVVLTCDALIERNHIVEMMELMLSVYEDAEIYTLIHKPGAVIGPIEQRSIKSTFLSNKVKSREDLDKNLHLLPIAAKKLFIPCSVDLIINFSSGFSQGIPKCKESKMISYFFKGPEDFNYAGITQKLFKAYLKAWSYRTLRQADFIYASSDNLKDKVNEFLRTPLIKEVLWPSFKAQDFPLIPSSLWKHDFYAINTDDLTVEEGELVFNYLKEKGRRGIFVGKDGHLKALKEKLGEDKFFGDRCSGELAPFLSSSRALIDLSKGSFPLNPLRALSVGRPIITSQNSQKSNYLSKDWEGVNYIEKANQEFLGEALKHIDETFSSLDAKKVRGPAQKFHEIKFKSQMVRDINSLVQ